MGSGEEIISPDVLGGVKKSLLLIPGLGPN